MNRRLIILLGPTAVGKTQYSLELAHKYSSPIISCDSRQVFREMRIGTAVPDDRTLREVRHYFIQDHTINRPFSAGMYEDEAIALIGRLFAEGHDTLVMTGGSMLYIDAIRFGLDNTPQVPAELKAELLQRLETEGVGPLAAELKTLDPETCAAIDLSNGQRVIRALGACLATGRPFSSFKTGEPKARDFEIELLGLSRPREELYGRIDQRVLQMIDDGLEDEVRSLLPYRNLVALQTVGYKEMFDYLDGLQPLDETIRLIQRNTRHYAKKQLTWWRDQPIRWLPL